jgi:hypothetical protein
VAKEGALAPGSEDALSSRVERLSSGVIPAIHVPVTVFASVLSPAEALVKHLKEHKQFRLVDIARLLNRDQRGIGNTYKRAQRKHSASLVFLPSEHSVPATVFQDRTLSILEHVVSHLRNQNVPVKTIAVLLGKSPSTIAVVHHRARRKTK